LEPVSLMIKNSRLRCFGHVEREKKIMTESNGGKLKELDREDAQKRPRGIVLKMTWKV